MCRQFQFALLSILFVWAVPSSEIAWGQAGPIPRRLITQQVDDRALVTLRGNTRPEAIATNDRGPMAGDFPMEHLQIQLRLPPEREQQLEQLNRDLLDPGSPRFHKWLTPAQFKDRFSLAPEDIDAVSLWLQSQGFTVNVIYPRSIDISGTAGQVRNAFRTELHNLEVRGVKHFGNMSDPRIPAAIAPAVVGIASLNDFMPHKLSRPRANDTIGDGRYLVVPADLAAIYNFNPIFARGISGQGQTIVVIEDSNVFNYPGDWNAFRSALGLSGYASGAFMQVHPAPLTGTNNCVNPGLNRDDDEAILDAEWASAGAPSATIELASCASIGNFGGFIALQNLLNGSGTPPAIVSISYGESEPALGAAGNASINALYEQAAAEGVAVFVSSADEGAASSDHGTASATHGIAVSGFSSTPYNVSVGGTDFADTYLGSTGIYWNPAPSTATTNYGSANSYIPEVPWNNSCASQLLANYHGYAMTYGASGFCNSATGENFLDVTGGGGGPSGCAAGVPTASGVVSGTCAGYAKPGWQSVFGNPSDNVRDTPDVSLFASNGLWKHYYVVCFSSGGSCSGTPDTWAGFGGTSIAAPIMASVQALINQAVGSNSGNPNPTYYSLAAAEYGDSGSAPCNSEAGGGPSGSCVFYDVTLGDMDVNCTGTNNCYLPSGTYGVLSASSSDYRPAYGSTTGWDFATGIGTVNVANLVNAWPRQNRVVPNVVGDTQAVAMAAIANAGLIVGTVSTASSGTVPSGEVISEHPLGGASAIAGSAVDLVVSGGPPNVSVPNVVGFPQAAAITAIEGAALELGTVAMASSVTVPSGNVISENPSAGTLVASGAMVNLVVSSGQETPPVATASFIGNDNQTQGTWQTASGRIYGTDGYSVAGSSQSLPSYVTQFSTPGGTPFSWASSTSDWRAPLNGNDMGRVAACLYAASSFSLNINFATGTHLFAIYALDWDSSARSETVTILDPNDGYKILDTETISDFHGGTYLVWNVSGQVVVQIHLESGANAVISGIFFGVSETVGVSPPSVLLSAGQQQQFRAVSTGTPGVIWSLVPAGLTSGQISPSGQYTAPAAIPELLTVSVQATSQDGTAAGSATVTLTPANNQVSVPNVVGNLQTAATAAITGAGLAIGTITTAPSDTVPSGNVISESPMAGATVDLGTAVNLVLSVGGGALAPAAVFTRSDLSTQGNWVGAYGVDGYYLINALPPQLPVYAAFSAEGARAFTWNSGTSDVRALQTSTGSAPSRIAATWYNPSSFDFDVNFTDNNSHEFALYAVDWDSAGRSETVSIVDPSNNNSVLDVEHITRANLAHGQYLLWNISGHVKIIVALDSGSTGNAVVSGVFFGAGNGGASETVTVEPQTVTLAASQRQTFTAAVTGNPNQNVIWSVVSGPGTIDSTSGIYVAPTAVFPGKVTVKATSADGIAFATATITLSQTAGVSFVGSDSNTKGNWQGVYGADGEMIVNGPQLSPSGGYGTFNGVGNASPFVWLSTASDTRALETGLGPTGMRTASSWYGATFYFDIAFNGPQQLELYALDWDFGGRVETITIVDPSNNVVLDAETVSSFTGGKYLTWSISGHVKIVVTQGNGANAVISGVFFN